VGLAGALIWEPISSAPSARQHRDEPHNPAPTHGALTTVGVDVYMRPQQFDAELTDTMTADGVLINFHAIVAGTVHSEWRHARL
jgi:hypothetical protein